MHFVKLTILAVIFGFASVGHASDQFVFRAKPVVLGDVPFTDDGTEAGEPNPENPDDGELIPDPSEEPEAPEEPEPDPDPELPEEPEEPAEPFSMDALLFTPVIGVGNDNGNDLLDVGETIRMSFWVMNSSESPSDSFDFEAIFGLTDFEGQTGEISTDDPEVQDMLTIYCAKEILQPGETQPCQADLAFEAEAMPFMTMVYPEGMPMTGRAVLKSASGSITEYAAPATIRFGGAPSGPIGFMGFAMSEDEDKILSTSDGLFAATAYLYNTLPYPITSIGVNFDLGPMGSMEASCNDEPVEPGGMMMCMGLVWITSQVVAAAEATAIDGIITINATATLVHVNGEPNGQTATASTSYYMPTPPEPEPEPEPGPFDHWAFSGWAYTYNDSNLNGSPDVGESVNWSYTINNPGPHSHTGLHIKTNFGGGAYPNAHRCPQTSLSAGQSMTCTGTDTIDMFDMMDWNMQRRFRLNVSLSAADGVSFAWDESPWWGHEFRR